MADRASLSFLAYLTERVEDLRVLIVARIRSGEELPAALSVLTSRRACQVLSCMS